MLIHRRELGNWMTPAALALTIVMLMSALGGASATAVSLGPTDGAELPATDLKRIVVGESAPDFTLEDQEGTPITLSKLRGKTNVVLVFYRGHW